MLSSASDKGLVFGVAKKNTVRLCTNDIVMAQQQQLPLLLLSLRLDGGKVAELLLVAGDAPAALGDELLDALVDLGVGGDNLVLYVLSDNRIT
jgi:hypothetical protein